MFKKILITALIFFPGFIFAIEIIDINNANLQQLDKLTGVGPVIAQRIIDARPFSSVDDLDRVKGIGPATLNKIKAQGLACINCSAKTLPKQEKPAKNNIDDIEKSLAADIILPVEPKQNTSPWLLFFSTLAVAIIAGAFVLFIKHNNVRT